MPTYNERHNVEKMVRDLLALPIESDLLFLDDNSPDGTGEILDRLSTEIPELTVIHRRGKLGIGSAHIDGIRWAYDHGFERLITLDCDFTHDPRDVMRLVENSSGYDVTVGSRYLSEGSLPGWNLVRRSLTAFGHVLTRYLLRIQFDATGALRCYDLRKIPRELFERVRNRGYGFFFESMFALVRTGHSVNEFPIVLPARTYGSSKMTPRETLRSGSQLLTLWMRSLVNSNLYRPFREASEPPHVSESWDSYWSAKSKPSGRMYDLVAGIYRQQVIRKRLEKVLTDAFDNGSHLLHAGCGSGQVDERLHDRLRITAVDISSAAARLYRSNNPTSSGVFEADISALPFPDATFDGVYNLGVMEHFDAGAIVQILSELNRVLKPGARLVLFWPHRRATSVAVLGSAHWIMNDLLKRSVQLHPPEVSLLKSRKWVEELLAEARLTLESYSFGPADFFVQAVVVARTNAAPAAHA